ncbi:hypothetical protein LXL04_006614 [Taraxacum kok-saghyz]
MSDMSPNRISHLAVFSRISRISHLRCRSPSSSLFTIVFTLHHRLHSSPPSWTTAVAGHRQGFNQFNTSIVFLGIDRLRNRLRLETKSGLSSSPGHIRGEYFHPLCSRPQCRLHTGSESVETFPGSLAVHNAITCDGCELQVQNIRDPPSIADPNSLPIFLGSSKAVSLQRLLNGCSPDTALDNSLSDISGILRHQQSKSAGGMKPPSYNEERGYETFQAALKLLKRKTAEEATPSSNGVRTDK